MFYAMERALRASFSSSQILERGSTQLWAGWRIGDSHMVEVEKMLGQPIRILRLVGLDEVEDKAMRGGSCLGAVGYVARVCGARFWERRALWRVCVGRVFGRAVFCGVGAWRWRVGALGYVADV